jgi:hypothetical protein
MSQPFSGLPDPGSPSPFRRRSPQGVVQENVREMWREARRRGERAMRAAQRHGGDLWRKAKRHPRAFGLTGVAVVITMVGAYALNASGRSHCPPAGEAKASRFLLLMDPVPHPAAGSELTINYDVCGLKSGTPFRGRVRLTQALPAAPKKGKKKTAAKPKVVAVNFKDEADGPADRRRQELQLGSTKPGSYTLELSVTDNMGRERKRLQKLVVKAQ